MTLVVPRALADAMLDHVRACLPAEACGILSGSRATGRARAFHPARNEHASPLRYSVHPEDLVRIVLGIERRGEDLLAIFHSHVSAPAVPSAADVREARYPDALHVVATLAPSDGSASEMRAWRIVDGSIREVPLELS